MTLNDYQQYLMDYFKVDLPKVNKSVPSVPSVFKK